MKHTRFPDSLFTLYVLYVGVSYLFKIRADRRIYMQEEGDHETLSEDQVNAHVSHWVFFSILYYVSRGQVICLLVRVVYICNVLFDSMMAIFVDKYIYE